MAYYIFNDYENRWLSISGLGVPMFRTKQEQQDFVKLISSQSIDGSRYDSRLFRIIKDPM